MYFRLEVPHSLRSLMSKLGQDANTTSLKNRGLHSLTAAGSDRLFLFAGAPKEGPMLGDLWGLDLSKHAWEELDPDGKVPHVRCSQAAAAVGSDIFFVGGSYYK